MKFSTGFAKFLQLQTILLGIGFWIFTMLLSNAAEPSKNFTRVVFGGSGTITRSSITPEIESQYRASLDRALKAGQMYRGYVKNNEASVTMVYKD